MPYLDFEEGSLVSLARKGDRDAFGELVRRDLPLAYSQAWGLSLNREDAWDIALDAYKKAWAAIPVFDATCRFGVWRYAILRRVFLDFHRKSSRRGRFESRPDAELWDCPDPSETPEEAALAVDSRAELAARVRDALSRLSPVYRLLLKLVDMRRYRTVPGGRSKRKSRYAVVLRYFRLLSQSPRIETAIPYSEGLGHSDVRRLHQEVRKRNAYDLKLLHARQAFAQELRKEGPLGCDTKKPDLPAREDSMTTSPPP